MEPTVWINKIKFKNGFDFNLDKNAILVFVGPNNAGKSKSLQEIFKFITSADRNGLVLIDNVETSFEGHGAELTTRLEGRKQGNSYTNKGFNNPNTSIHKDYLVSYWNGVIANQQTPNHKQIFSTLFTKFMDTSERLGLVSPPNNIDFITQGKSHPIHILKEDSIKEKDFSKYFKLAFGEDVIVNHGAGSFIPLHVGDRPLSTAENDRVSTIYQKQLRALPLLHEQGDGMKSFAGVFLNLFAEAFSVNIVDEPEAFLHPPQASLLGQMIAQKLDDNKQLIVATHSEHFLKGLLDSAADRLIIVRIQRDNSTSKINILENKEVQSIWNDSLLRHSNILDGLFHKKVVLCESDSDCRFYNGFSTALVEQSEITSPDILFIQSGGKHRFPVVIRALKTLEVPLTIIGDFDFYHNENPTRFIFEELGGSWADIKSDFNKVKKAIDEKRPELEAEALKAEIDGLFDSFTDKIILEEKIKAIQSALKKSSPWSQAKASGKAYLPAGEATLAFNRLQTAFKEKNIHILEMGEIEAFDKSIGGHGPKWVSQILEKDLINAPELSMAREFVKENILS